jgi:hypothetical protein
MAKFIDLPDNVVVNIELIQDYRPWLQVPNIRMSKVPLENYTGVKFSKADIWQAYKIQFKDFDTLVKARLILDGDHGTIEPSEDLNQAILEARAALRKFLTS